MSFKTALLKRSIYRPKRVARDIETVVSAHGKEAPSRRVSFLRGTTRQVSMQIEAGRLDLTVENGWDWVYATLVNDSGEQTIFTSRTSRRYLFSTERYNFGSWVYVVREWADEIRKRDREARRLEKRNRYRDLED